MAITGWTLEFSKVGKSERGAVKSSIEFLPPPLPPPSSFRDLEQSIFYNSNLPSRDPFALVYPFIDYARNFFYFPSREWKRFERARFAEANEVEMKFSPYPGKSSEERNRPRFPQFPPRRKKNRGCVRGYGIPAFRPTCFHTVNNNGGSFAERERTSMPLLVPP